MFRTSIGKEKNVEFWGLLNPMEKKNFELYENGHFCATILKKQENNGNLKRKHYATISGQLSLVEEAMDRS